MAAISDPGVQDPLSALSWVQEELRRSLDTAHKALRRYLKEQAQRSDLDTIDPNVLRQARSQIHQSVGVLELVGLGRAAELLRAAEAALQRISSRPKLLTPAAVDAIEHGSFALMEFIDRRLAGKPVSTLALFPPYKALQELAGAQRVHPADLWTVEWSWREAVLDTKVAQRHPDEDTFNRIEADLLALMRGAPPSVAARMSELFAGLAAGAQAVAREQGRLQAGPRAPHSRLATLWQLAAGFFEAQADGLLQLDAYSKRLGSRLLSQLRAGESAEPSERLAHDLLFFCAQAAPRDGHQPGPRLAVVRQGYQLADAPAVDYERAKLGRFDPAWVAQACKRVAAAKEVWSAVAGGDLARVGGLSEQFVLVSDSLVRLYPDGGQLGRSLQVAIAHTAALGTEPPAELAMEVATALLYLEASLDDGDFDHADGAHRIQRLAQRIDAVRQARDPGTLDLWMEELYRRVSDRQTMGSVVQELRASLSEIEKNIDQYFRNPTRREVLIPVPAQLSAMRGVLSVLGLDQASQAVLRMRDDVDALSSTEVNPQHAIQTGTFDRLADNLGALSFLIDMVSVQPQMAKSLFRFNPDTGSLAAVMAREDRPTGFDAMDTAAAEYDDAPPDTDALAVTLEFDRIVKQSRLAQRSAAPVGGLGLPMLGGGADAIPTTQAGVHQAEAALPASAVDATQRLSAVTVAASLAPPSTVSSGLEDDPEMREVFLDEAREVLETAQAALADLQSRHDDQAAFNTVRRAFHTLKGSARMVGLRPFGEAAWACEQLYNARLSEPSASASASADTELREFSLEACRYFGQWVQAIEAGDVGTFDPACLIVPADALRGGQRRPISGDALRPPDTVTLGGPASADGLQLRVPGLPSARDLDLFSSPMSAPAQEALFDLDTLAGEFDSEPALPALELALIDAEPSVRVPALPEAAKADNGQLPMITGSDTVDWGPTPTIPVAETLSLDLGLDDLGLSELGFPAAASPPPAAGTGRAVPAADTVTRPSASGLGEPTLPSVDDDLVLSFRRADDEPASVDLVLDDLPPMPPAPAPGLPVPTEVLQGPPADRPALALVDAPVPAAGDGEAYRQIGPLRIGIPLFNIYLNEADELSRRLGIELAEWSLEQHRRVGESAVAMAHSLAGSSGAVGYTDLSQLARELEHALDRSQARGHGQGPEARIFTQAADEIRRLLHLFAAGFLNSPDAELMQALRELSHGASQAANLTQAAPPTASTRPASPVAEASAAAAAAAAVVHGATTEVSLGVAPLGSMAAPGMPAAPLGRPALRPFVAMAAVPQAGHRTLDTGPAFDDDIDQIDAVDAELFPIFVEEAQELLLQLQTRLREWAQRPAAREAASACMRSLHTFKGSARLAGAMRLGELAHRLETQIERLSADPERTTAAAIELLVSHADVLEAGFEALRKAPALPVTPVAAPASAALAAPVAAARPLAPAATPGPVARPRAAPPAATAAPQSGANIDWRRFTAVTDTAADAEARPAGLAAAGSVRVHAPLLDRLVNHAGEVSITRARIESDVGQLKGGLADLTDNLDRLRAQLRDIELQAETQIGTRLEAARAALMEFDPLEMDRFTRFQELTRMMAESVADVATVQRGLQRTLQSTEDALAHQARMTRDMQDDLLRTRMVEFEGLSERLYRVVRQAAKETTKAVRLDIEGGGVEIDRGVLDRMLPSFEHLLRNCVVHGIESPALRAAAHKDAVGTITMAVTQVGNEVAVEVRDDGAGLNLAAIQARGLTMGLLGSDDRPDEAALANLIFQSGFSTAETITDLAGRGVGMDVVRTDVNAMGGRIETASAPGRGTSIRLVLPLTTAVTQVVMLRCGERSFAVPSTLVEVVRRMPLPELARAYETGQHGDGQQAMPFFWLDSLLQGSPRGVARGRTAPVVVIRSAAQRVMLHVDDVVGNQEVVVKNLGPQLARVPGLVGMTLLPSGLPALIYNPVALATLYGDAARQATAAALGAAAGGAAAGQAGADAAKALAPLVLVVDDSLTVRRITQRLLEREGYRVTVAKDGLDGLDKLGQEVPAVLLTDIEMPRMDGFDLVRNMRTDARLSQLPVVMITSRIAQKHRDYAAELGVDHYLGKPYVEEELLKLVARYARRPPGG